MRAFHLLFVATAILSMGASGSCGCWGDCEDDDSTPYTPRQGSSQPYTPPTPNPPVAALQRTDLYAVAGQVVPLDASASHDDAGRPLTFAWTLYQQPDGAQPSLQPAEIGGRAGLSVDVPGTYGVSVVVTTDDGRSAEVRATVEAYPSFPVARHPVPHAAYSASLDRAVALYRDQLILMSTAGDTASVTLPLPGLSVCVSPDGGRAVVGHDGWISVVDLAGPSVAASLRAPAVVTGCAVAAGGWAYLLSGAAGQPEPLRSIDLATGEVQADDAGPRLEGGEAQLHSDGSSLYVAYQVTAPDLSPQPTIHFARWDVSGGPARHAASSTHVEGPLPSLVTPVPPGLWLDGSGDRLFTSGGAALTTAPGTDADLAYAGRLAATPQEWVSGADARASEVTVIMGASVTTFDPLYLKPRELVALPPWAQNGNDAPPVARYLFRSADGARRYAVVELGGWQSAVVTY